MTDTSVFDTGTNPVPYTYSGGGNLAPGATDYSGSYGDPYYNAAYNPADPMNFLTGGYSGGYSSGLVDASGQTIPQVMSSDPGSQLSQDQQPPQQPVAQAGAGVPVSGVPLVGQPSGLSNLVQQLTGSGANPWSFGTGARQSPQVPTPSPQQMQAAQQQLGSQLAARYPQPAPPQPAPELQTMPMPAPQPETASLQPAPGAKKEQQLTPPAEDSTDEGPQRTRTPETAPPAPQGQRQQYPRSPLQGFIDQILGAMGLRPLIAQQGPYAGRPINQIPWATPQQIQQYQRTGQFPQRNVDPRTGMAPGFSRDARGNVTYKGQPPDMHAPGPNGNSVPMWSPRAIQAGDNAERNAQQNGVFGPPPANQGQAQRGAAPTTAGTPYLYTGDARGVARPYGTNFAGTQPPTAYDKWANQGGIGTPPSQQTAGARFQVPPGASARQQLQYQVANEMAAGPNSMSNNAIAGVLPNIGDESDWNPASSHYDQPRYSPRDEAAYSHGLLQEGGPDWPAFKQFLNGRDWRDPRLQIQFMKQHMQERSPQAWQRMNNARTPGEAAAIFVNEYLRPAPQYASSRTARYLRGVPSAEQQLARQ